MRVLASRLFHRLLYTRWVSRVYSGDAVTTAARWPAGYVYRWYARRSAAPEADLQRLRAQRRGGFLNDLSDSDGLYVVWHGDTAASWGAAPGPGRQQSVLGLPRGSRLIGLCETHPDFRGQGLYVQALLDTVAALRASGEQHIYIEVLEDNTASIKGIERAGFRTLGRVDARIFFGALVWRSGRLWKLKA